MLNAFKTIVKGTAILNIYMYLGSNYSKLLNKIFSLRKTVQFSSKIYVCLFVLRFYGPVNPVGSCRARSVYLTTRLLGRLSPPSG